METSSALRATLTRIARLGAPYELTIAPGDDGWIPAADLVSGGSVFEEVIERVGGDGVATRRAVGSRLVLLYLRFAWPAIASFALERRVPDVAASNLLVRLDSDGWPVAFAIAEPRYAALVTDAAAGGASATASDAAGLLDWLQARAIEENAATLIETVRSRLLTSGTALWGNVAAAFVHPLLWHVQHVAAESSSVVRDAEAILDWTRAPRLGDQVRLLRMVEGDDAWTVHARRTCCLRWCLPGQTRCEDCPLVREPQAGEFLRTRLAEAVSQGESLRAELGFGERDDDIEPEARPA